MFGLENLDSWKLLVLLLVAVLIFGPDKLPKAIADGVRMLRNMRDMARNATSDLSRELGTDIQLEDLNPKALIRKHLLSEEEERTLRKPLEDLYRDVQSDVKGLTKEINETAGALDVRRKPAATPATPTSPARRAIDTDAT
jgi:sec-independent protein translocase protein TatB